MRTNIRPNTITLIYAFCGILGFVFLSLPFKNFVFISLIIFFLKGVFDWTDGHLARKTNQTSMRGHILDVYGAHVNELGFYLGLGFYVLNFSDNYFFKYLLPIYPFLIAINIVTYSKIILFNENSIPKKY